MQSFLQIWGGLFYLLNKIFFSRTERSQGPRRRIWRIWSWSVYLVGLPAWIAIFIRNRNWALFAVETAGAVGMTLGLVRAIRGMEGAPRWLDYTARFAALFGIAYSLYDFGGLTTWNQVLEFGVVAGFLAGTYYLTDQKPRGYLWFLLMNGSNAALQGIQGYPWLMIQQVVSLGFVLDAYFMCRRKIRLSISPITPRAA